MLALRLQACDRGHAGQWPLGLGSLGRAHCNLPAMLRASRQPRQHAFMLQGRVTRSACVDQALRRVMLSLNPWSGARSTAQPAQFHWDVEAGRCCHQRAWSTSYAYHGAQHLLPGSCHRTRALHCVASSSRHRIVFLGTPEVATSPGWPGFICFLCEKCGALLHALAGGSVCAAAAAGGI